MSSKEKIMQRIHEVAHRSIPKGGYAHLYGSFTLVVLLLFLCLLHVNAQVKIGRTVSKALEKPNVLVPKPCPNGPLKPPNNVPRILHYVPWIPPAPSSAVKLPNTHIPFILQPPTINKDLRQMNQQGKEIIEQQHDNKRDIQQDEMEKLYKLIPIWHDIKQERDRNTSYIFYYAYGYELTA